jgi:hypothetical protein
VNLEDPITADETISSQLVSKPWLREVTRYHLTPHQRSEPPISVARPDCRAALRQLFADPRRRVLGARR